MLDLDAKYLTKLNDIKVSIQHSEELAAFLEEEEEELYLSIKDKFEPSIEELYEEVAAADPLQVVSFEKELLDGEYEGLFLPRILGYSVMRGQINENIKYVKPQQHFKQILLTICNSANFEMLRMRSGKTIEIGFSLSSDIWITNLLNEIDNKRVRQYLESLRLLKYRDERIRHTAYVGYKKQFANFNYLTAELPENCPDLNLNGESMVEFLMFRAKSDFDNTGIKKFISDLIISDLTKCPEYLRVLLVLGLYFDLDGDDAKAFADQWNKMHESGGFDHIVFGELIDMQQQDFSLSGEHFSRLASLLKSVKEDEATKYVHLMVQVDEIGYINDEATELIRSYYNNHEGLSSQNEAARTFIFNKFRAFVRRLSNSDFHEYFEFNPVFINYMNIFSNEKFNQNLKAELLKYVKGLLRTYTDKRSKDYQDIKKFVQATFVDMGFMDEKAVKELFKRKRKPTKA